MSASFPQRAVHFDFHTMPGVMDVGTQFDGDAFADALRAAHVGFVNVFARCNVGFAYYPTKIGTVHPGLQTDLLGRMVESCHSRDILVSAYFNVGLSHEEAIRHPEWCHVNLKGQIYDLTHDDNPFFRRMCLNTGYADHLKAMIREVMELYPVDGFFLDCMVAYPCHGNTCVQGRLDAGMDPRDDEGQARQFAIRVTERFRRDVGEIIAKSPRKLKLFFNGAIPYREQLGHIEIETLPAGGWGYEELPWQVRYARTLNKPILAMTGRFQKGWGDFGGLLPEHALLHDCLLATSLGASCSIGDHLHPRGYWEPAVQERITRVFTHLEALDPWTIQAKSLADILVLEPSAAKYPQSYFNSEPLKGVRRMLSELHYQFDVSDGAVDFSEYKVIILPDHTELSDDLLSRLQSFLAEGGCIIGSARAGLSGTEFSLSKGKFRSMGDETFNPAYFVATQGFVPGLVRMPTAIYESGIMLEAEADVEILAELHQPYFNMSSWHGQHLNLYIPPDRDAGRPALVRLGRLYQFSFPVFQGYFRHAPIAYRQLVEQCLAQSLAAPLVTTNLPSFAQITLTEQTARRMIHMLAYLPEMRGGKVIAQEPLTVPEGVLDVRLDGLKISHVYRAPDRQTVPFEIKENFLRLTSPQFTGYQLLVIE